MDERTIEVIIDAFIVVIGVAIERFLTKFPLGSDEVFYPPPIQPYPDEIKPKHNKFYWWCYVPALMVVVSLVIRFLIGSDYHLRHRYMGSMGKSGFIFDICVLMVFGAFIVKAALSERVDEFAFWLACCSGLGVGWSLWALCRRDNHGPVLGWFKINFCLLLVTLLVMGWCRHFRKRSSPKLVIAGLMVLCLFYCVGFYCDVKGTIKSELDDRKALIQSFSPPA